MSTLSTTNIKHPSSASNNVVLDSSGRVGIGTGNPQNNLVVSNNGATGVEIYFADSGASGAILSYNRNTSALTPLYLTGQDVRFQAGGSDRAKITSSGDLQFNSGYGSVATAYGCRAWINFQGNGGYATRGSGNISSFTEVGSGNGGVYNVNLTSALPDTNGAILCSKTQSQPHENIEGVATGSYVSTSQLRVVTGDWDGTYVRVPHYSATYVHVAVFR